MKAERDIAIPPRGQAASVAKKRGGLSGFFRLGRKRARRGEREAHNLLWRRRFKAAERMLSTLLLASAVAFCFEAWRGGAIDLAGQSLHTGLDHMMVQAGLTVEEVRIKGQDRTPLAQIRAALDIHPKQSIFAVNLDEARRKIERLNWVKTASVSRQLPNGISVNIVERTPLALWQDKGHIWLIDQEGMTLTDRDIAQFSDLPMVVGEGAPQKAASLLSLLKSDSGLYSRVKASVRVSNRRWDLILVNGVRVRLPDEDENKAYARLVSYQKETQILERDVSVIDLRFPGRLVLRLDHGANQAGSGGHDDLKSDIKGKGDEPKETSSAIHHRGREI
jgi:cell division protein FtsQ